MGLQPRTSPCSCLLHLAGSHDGVDQNRHLGCAGFGKLLRWLQEALGDWKTFGSPYLYNYSVRLMLDVL